VSLAFNPNNALIGASAPKVSNAFLPKRLAARSAGSVEEYHFTEIKPKKQLKEIRKVLVPEKKRFIFKYGFKFNVTNICVVCGTQHTWDMSDPYRPGIPLHQVTKGKPLRGTYCQKHAAIYKQMEMLEQQILANEHGLEFRRFIPKPRMPQVLQSKGPLTTLSRADLQSLIAVGWIVTAPKKSKENPQEEYNRLAGDIKNNLERMEFLVNGGEE